MINLGMRYPVSLPSPEATAARLGPALGVAPIYPRPRLARPSGMCGTYRPLGLRPTAPAQTPCRTVATISTTDKKNVSVVLLHVQKKRGKIWPYMVNVENVVVARQREVQRGGRGDFEEAVCLQE